MNSRCERCLQADGVQVSVRDEIGLSIQEERRVAGINTLREVQRTPCACSTSSIPRRIEVEC
jgi:hypothetical protein